MLMTELDYKLPPQLIATAPAEPRDHSRLLVYTKSTHSIEHRRFFNLPDYLRPGDLMIVNDTRVIPAKLELRKPTGSFIPGLFLAEKEIGTWEVMLRSRGRLKVGDTLHAGDFQFKATARTADKGTWLLTVTPPLHAAEVLAKIGHVPLPPYIEKMRESTTLAEESLDRTRYQTIYANQGNSLAAPTAGLHFTPELLAKITALGVTRAAVELQVGLGTFLPVETETLEAHPMHIEHFSIPPATIAAIHATHPPARKVIIGTTAVRALESAADKILSPSASETEIRGSTNLKISPGYQFRLTDVLLTNFHLPRSTLMALVAAMITLPKLHELYALAIRESYRFYSYGDAMLILP